MDSKTLKGALVLAALLLACTAAAALTAVSEEELHRAVEGYVRQALEGKTDPRERFEIHVRWQGDILLEGEGRARIRVRPLSRHPFRGPAVVRAELQVGGQTQRTLTLTVDTRFYRRVLVASRGIRRKEIFTAEMVEVAERDITDLKEGFFTDFVELQDAQARRPLGAGGIITRRHVEKVPLVHRGDEVLLVLESRTMQLSVLGEALQDGGAGERIRVRNRDSGRVMQGKVVDDKTIRMGR